MSLFAALTSHEFKYAETKDRILTIYKHDPKPGIVLFSCFSDDVEVVHPQFGRGKLFSVSGKKWTIEFDNCYEEFQLKNLLSFMCR